ncbi:helix-turn-helix domain-containing protein [Mucisphaera calidilacus]|uniref:HTH-type transcriptional activator Btr n=1 Tax=Mucisphaera calidilacus TaxID=2527982 RepID=A0A518C0B0_9BACT|nr:AraC family transcriptional regulator [Mucisphaera calidilacus]QDU72658.1 HTH-type transcriptional activator Btr [Mucisphaera calidilacus]
MIRASAIETMSPEQAVLDACSRLFRREDAVADVLVRRLHGPIEVAPHMHREGVQFVLLRRCGGRVCVQGNWLGVSGTTLLVSYPGDRHGYELKPSSARSEMVVVKLAMDPHWPAARHRPWPDIVASGEESPRLTDAIDRLQRDVRPVGPSVPLWVADAAGVLCAWPRTDQPGITQAHSEDEDPAIQAALSLIEEHPEAPPSLAQMASVAHLSPRQFTRRFERAVGRTPHAYVNERRIERAKALLFDDRVSGEQVARALGFSSQATFTRWFRQHTGRTPMQYRTDPGVL